MRARSISTSPSRRAKSTTASPPPVAGRSSGCSTTSPLDARWHLVHATHATPEEILGVAARSAGVVLCPTTEANLGDGLPDLQRWLASGARLSIGSDSQVTRDWREELRLLEYGQRLAQRRRNIAADGQQSTATRLFERALAGERRRRPGSSAGASSPGRAPISSSPIRRTTRCADVPAAHLLDAMVFVSPGEALPRRDGRGRVGPPQRRPGRPGLPPDRRSGAMSTGRHAFILPRRVITAGCKHIPRTPTQ